jgi:hypothetical protein
LAATDSAPGDGSELTVQLRCATPLDGSAKTITQEATVTWHQCP